MNPWNQVDVDLIGPWKIKINNLEVIFNTLTCIDPVTNLTEMIRINNRTSIHVAEQFSNCWLARYPRPNRCVHDKGSEFIGIAFQTLFNKNSSQSIRYTGPFFTLGGDTGFCFDLSIFDLLSVPTLDVSLVKMRWNVRIALLMALLWVRYGAAWGDSLSMCAMSWTCMMS